jgi:hypothetical protein
VVIFRQRGLRPGHNRKNTPIRAGLSLKPLPPYRLLGHKRTGLPYMSTIELVDPELRDALAQGPLLPFGHPMSFSEQSG